MRPRSGALQFAPKLPSIGASGARNEARSGATCPSVPKDEQSKGDHTRDGEEREDKIRDDANRVKVAKTAKTELWPTGAIWTMTTPDMWWRKKPSA